MELAVLGIGREVLGRVEETLEVGHLKKPGRALMLFLERLGGRYRGKRSRVIKVIQTQPQQTVPDLNPTSAVDVCCSSSSDMEFIEANPPFCHPRG